jgi:hypothetical protein
MEDSFEIKTPEPEIKFGMTKKEQEEVIKKLKLKKKFDPKNEH